MNVQINIKWINHILVSRLWPSGPIWLHICVNIGPCSDLLSDDTKLLPEPMLLIIQFRAILLELLMETTHKRCPDFTLLKWQSHLTRGQWVQHCCSLSFINAWKISKVPWLCTCELFTMFTISVANPTEFMVQTLTTYKRESKRLWMAGIKLAKNTKFAYLLCQNTKLIFLYCWSMCKVSTKREKGHRGLVTPYGDLNSGQPWIR